MKQPTEFVYVTWLDSAGQGSWTRTLPEEESLGMASVGWLLEETETSIVIGVSYGCRVEDDNFSIDSPTRIPKATILRIERHKPPPWVTWRLPKKRG